MDTVPNKILIIVGYIDGWKREENQLMELSLISDLLYS